MPDTHAPAHCDAVILAGGKATRLQSVVNDRPKFLADIGGQPFAHYLLNQLSRAGFRRIIICTGHLADTVEATLGPKWGGVDIIYSREEIPLDTGGAVRLSLAHLESENAVIINGDTFLKIDFADFLHSHVTSGALSSLALTRVTDASRYGSVLVSGHGRITGFVEKTSTTQGTDIISAGIYAVHRSLIAAIPAARKISIEREIMPYWIKKGMMAYLSPGPFIDIGTPQSYALAQNVLDEWTKKTDRTSTNFT